jgi:hypothetical protein
MKHLIILALCATLAACGGGDDGPKTDEELFKERALGEMVRECLKENGSGLESWDWHVSYYPYGPLKGQVFARGWTAYCAANERGIRMVIPRHPPVI